MASYLKYGLPYDEQRQHIQEKLKGNIASLRQQGKLAFNPSTSGKVLFAFPMQWNTGFDDYGFYAISNFVDHDLSYPGSIEDYNCGSRSYDTQAGYNHRGTDYYLWPFEWNLVEDDAVKIVAAAPGVIIGKDDGNDHHSCSFSSDNWNAVYLMHGDGSTTWYGHMKKNSLTTKNVGETVSAGEFLGIVGSSGNSTGPHLHFEIYDEGSSLIDPYNGDCNMWNAESWWVDQRPYIDPAINKIQTHFAPPGFNACPGLADINASDEFEAGELVYFITYFKDQQSTDMCQFSIIQPDHEIFDSWIFFQPQSYFSSSYWYWSYYLPKDAPEGEWTFQCEFAGEIYSHDFIVGDVSSVNGDENVLNEFFLYSDNNNLTLQAKSLISFQGEIFILDVTGRKRYNSNLKFVSGENRFNIPCVNYSPGIYLVTLCSGDGYILCTKKIFLK